jgi:hypothetical protein
VRLKLAFTALQPFTYDAAVTEVVGVSDVVSGTSGVTWCALEG